MKNKTKLLIALLLVFVGVGLTYAIYNTSVGGNANVSAANWVIKLKTGGDFNNQTGIDISGGATDIDLGECEKLAPGGSCILPFRVDATETEVDMILTMELGSNVTGATLEELTNAGINLRIEDAGTEVYSYLLNMGSYKDLNLVINWEAGSDDDDVKAAYDVNIANKLSEITLPVNMTVKQRLGGTRTVTFNTHDSNIETPESIQVDEGETIENIPTLTKSQYVFLGWFTSEVGGVMLTSSTPIVDNIEYHARFRQAQLLTVSFNSNGGNNVQDEEIYEGTTIDNITTPTKTGYTFLGWFDDDNNELTSSTVINSNTTYTAKWEKTINYSLAGTLLYYDPVSEATCNASTYKGNNTCYKWYILNSDIDGYNIQIDRGLRPSSGNVIWATGSDNSVGPVKALESLLNITSTWTRVSKLNYEYDTSDSASNYGKLVCTDGVCNIEKNGVSTSIAGTAENSLRARLITVEEVAKASNNTSWSLSNQTNISGIPSWMKENMSSEYAYWTLTPTSTASTAYFVERGGTVGSYTISYSSSDRYLRPVIRLKSNINVTFEYQDGVTQDTVRNYELLDTSGSTPVMSTLGTLPVPSERAGYTFLGWYDSNGIEATSNSTVPSEDTIYYAHWNSTKSGDSILGILSDSSITSGNYLLNVGNETYSADVIVLNGDQTITSNTKYGELADCASGTETNQMAKNMVIVKVNGDYTVNSGVTVGPEYDPTYGGPKGFMLYVTGTLTNNGTIDNSHGAYAEGQDVILYKNQDNSYETVPALGALGGVPAQAPGSAGAYAVAGDDGVDRQTGGGASGAAWYDSSVSGAGGRGTSYSGGSGGGGVSRSGTTSQNNPGSSVGGAGGKGVNKGNSGNHAGGGAGNPGGVGSSSSYSGQNGTGGLLIIYANSFNNNNKITANGYAGGHNDYGHGGSSGGGSINIFYNTLVNANRSSIEAKGGISSANEHAGNGAVTIGSISSGQFTALN